MASQPLISHFFKQRKQTYEEILVPVDDGCVQKDFYDTCLFEQANNCNKFNCFGVKQRLRIQLSERHSKIQEYKKALSVVNRIRDKKRDQLEKMKTQLMDLQSNDARKRPVEGPAKAVKSHTENLKVNAEPAQSTKVVSTLGKTAAEVANEMLFSQFNHHFAVKELADLRSIGATQTEDSTFVLNAIDSLYSTNPERIAKISVSGLNRGPNAKEKMSPKKYTIMQDLFEERLKSLGLSCDSKNLRKKKLNSHIKNAFSNILAKKNKNKPVQF